MKKIILFTAVLFLVTSCKQQNKSQIESQIITYQKQANELTTKISDLQTQLEEQKAAENNHKALRISVETETVKPTLFKHYFEASAEIQCVHEAYISSEISGQIVAIPVKEGDYVKKGLLLARLETDVIESSIREVKTSLALAKFTYEKQKSLWSKHIGSELQYLQARTQMESLQNKLDGLESQYDKSFIKAPINGYIDIIDQKVGELAAPGIRLFHIVNLDSMYVNAQISEAYLPTVHPGDWVDISVPTYPDINLHEKIYRIGKVINDKNRTFKVQFNIKNSKELLKPNMLTTLNIMDYSNPDALVAPSFTIREGLDGYYLYVVEKDKGAFVASRRIVKIGKSYNGMTEIKEGLKPGEVIVTKGFNDVSNGVLLDINN
ncbi:MAG: efflux RND transporter periplasmic adaptor subunit [Bacteroidales bacterium]|nr:efflux RND transporter periplasmic adaptor subunit [Bacteroidales bacterium]